MELRKKVPKHAATSGLCGTIFFYFQPPSRYRGNEDRFRLGAFAIVGLLLFYASSASAGAIFGVTNLVTDNQGVNAAQLTDPSLLNPWGIAASSKSPFWIGDNSAGVATLYTVNPLTNVTTKSELTVTIPGDGSVTGVVFNGSAAAFNADSFPFVNEDGTISGWRGALGTTAQVLQAGSSANVYKGTAIATVSGNSYLYAANFRNGTIDVVKGNAAAPNLTGTFKDPSIPAGFAPFDVKVINGNLFVTYALQDATKHDDVAGVGNGFVSEFDLQGNFMGHRGIWLRNLGQFQSSGKPVVRILSLRYCSSRRP